MITLQAKKTDLLNAVKAVSALIDEAVFRLEPDGLKIRTLDFPKVAGVEIFVPAGEFLNYQVESAVKFGVKVNELSKRLVRCDDVITIDIEDMIRLKSGDKEYVMGAIEAVERDFPDLSGQTYSCKITMQKIELARIIEDLAVSSTRMNIEAGESVVFSGQSEMGQKVKITPAVQREGQANASYSLEYLTNMVKKVDADAAVLEFNTDHTLSLTLGNVKYYLGSSVAPQ